jgi:hypothetical protein
MAWNAFVRLRTASTTAREARFNRARLTAAVESNPIAIVASFYSGTDAVAADGGARVIAPDLTAVAGPSRFDHTSLTAPIECDRIAVITGFHTDAPSIAADGRAC